MKVLIADDSLICRTALKRALDDWQYTVVEATDGAEAWDMLQSDDPPRIAILDWYMPVMEGVTICEKLREQTTESYIYTILLTSSDERENLLRGLEAGADDFLGKPFDPEELKQRLRAGVRIIELQDRLLATQRTLQEKNGELDQFNYVVSHDLQEPIRKLICFSDLLRADMDGDLSEQAERDLGFIVDAAQRMRNLVHDLLALSRAGRAAMKRDEVDLDRCVDDALNVLELRVRETGAEMIRDPLPHVVGDKTMLTQLYQNLIGNALKFVAERQPVIHLTAERNGSDWVLGVKDNGIGMKSDYAERIFQPFQRLHRRDEYEGTGIGLAICQKTVRRHGGEIRVESEPGAGSHFTFTLSAEARCENAKPTDERDLSLC